MSQLTISDFANYKFLSEPSLSPDGKKAAFLIKEADLKENNYKSNIWLYKFDEQELLQLTSSGKDDKFVWTPDSEHLLFVSQREVGNNKEDEKEKKSHIYKIPLSGGEASKVFTVPHKIETMQLIQDKLIYKALVDINQDSNNEDETRGDYQVLDEIPFWANGKGFTNKKRNQLFIINLETENLDELTPGPINVGEFDSREREVIFAGTEYEDKMSIYNDVFVKSLDNGKTTKLTEGNRNFDLVRFLDEKTAACSSTDMKERGINQNKELFIISLSDGKLTSLTPGWDRSLRNAVLTDVRLGKGPRSQAANGKFYFITTEGGSSYLNSIDGSGNLERLADGSGSVDSFDVKNGRIVYVALRDQNLQELYTLEDGDEKRLTFFTNEPLSGKDISKGEHFTVDRGDVQIDAWLIKPTNFEAGGKYPTILEVHGGPKAVYSEVFFQEMQLLANRGYAIVFSNPRGSDGKGDEFSDIRGKFGHRDFEDLMAVVDTAVETYNFIDPNRLGVTGGSYGGFMTNWVIGHTDRFKAAVSQRSIANWISKFNTTDIGYFFVEDQQASTPWEDHKKLWDQSPLQFADRVKTPTLFIHADQDYRCWMSEGLQMFTALKYFGVTTKLCLFKDENHDLSRGGKPQNRISRLQEMINWFDKYLKDN